MYVFVTNYFHMSVTEIMKQMCSAFNLFCFTAERGRDYIPVELGL